MRRVVFAVPGRLDTPTGGYVYDRRLVAEMRGIGVAVDVLDLGEGFPQPGEDRRRAALDRLAGLPGGDPIVVDGLAYGVLPELADTLCRRTPVVALVHHPLARETGIDPPTARRFAASETTALAGAAGVVVTSETTKRLLVADYAVAPERITVAVPGTDVPGTDLPGTDLPGTAAAAGKRRLEGPVRLLAVGAVVPRKGYDLLVDALAALAGRDWTATIAGPTDRDPGTAARLRERIAAAGLASRITLTGAVSDETLADLYATADVFVLPSRYEGYGMAFAEAARHGLAIIGTTAGAIPEAVPPGAGLLIAPDDGPALVSALARLIDDPGERTRLATAAAAATAARPTWRETATRVVATLEALS